MDQSKAQATLNEYRAFHSMLCPPHVAKRCIDSLVGAGGGVFLFGTPDAHAGGRADCTSFWGVWPYYFLVLYSLTGLSTLLRLTDEVDAREFSVGDKAPIPEEGSKWLRSERNESVAVSNSAIECCRRAGSNQRGKQKCEDTEKLPSIRLRRRFEYDFRLIGLNVIMLHFMTTASTAKGGESELLGADSRELLHIVEVFQFRNPLVRFIGRLTEEIRYLASSFFPKKPNRAYFEAQRKKNS